jgi:hypothetical protein
MFARMLLEQGGDVYKFSRLMGHTDVKTTENYRKRVYQPKGKKAAGAILAAGAFRPHQTKGARAQSVKQGLEVHACSSLRLSRLKRFL